ncbi:MAG: NHLP family bacteriocin export ABC transporter peptidase/permease/ATPase subunit [Pseudomonadota bacterium]
MAEVQPTTPRRLRPRVGSRARTPTILQLEAAECGAASLAMILGRYGRHVPLEQLRGLCGVSRDGTKASNIIRAARHFGLNAKGLKAEPEHLRELPMPAIAFVDFCHFLVIEGIGAGKVWVNDPAFGPRAMPMQEFDERFTGVVLVFEPGPDFKTAEERPSLAASLFGRVSTARSGLAFLMAASLLLVLPGLLAPLFGRVFVDYVLVRDLQNWLLPLILGMAATAIVQFFLLELRNRALLRTETRLAVDGAGELFAHILHLPALYFGTRYAGEVAGRLGLSDGIAGLLTGEAAETLLNLITASFFLILIFLFSPAVALLVIVLAGLNIAAVLLSSQVIVDAHRKLSIDAGKLGGVEIAGLHDIETFKAAGTEDAFFTRWSGLHAQLVSTGQSVGQRMVLIRAIPQFLGTLTATGVLLIGGLEVMSGAITIGTLVALQSLSASFMGPVVALVSLGTSFQELRSFTERTDDVLHHPLDEGAESVADQVTNLPDGRIELRDVAFGYLPLDPPLIEDLNLTVKPGRSVALVGGSGSGKSTIGRLIVGLYPPQQGEVRIGDKPISEWPRQALTNRIAYIDQTITLFEGTVRDNLTLWDPTVPESAIVRAARDAMIHDVIAARSGAYDSLVEEGGRNFSGGQKQRLEIARALTCDPAIIVMDEATSALDATTEAELMTNIRARGATLVIIAHRLSTIRDCDEILVLERGKPVERGRHRRLLASGGAYKTLLES